MAYEFRQRRNNVVHSNYYCSDDSDTEENNRSNDPDYTRRGPGPSRRRAPTRNPTETPRQRQKVSTAAAAPPPEQPSTSNSAQPEADDKTVISWLVSRGELTRGETVKCGVKEGVVTADKISCSCCGAAMSVAKFMSHVDDSLARPFENVIVTRTNGSLLQHFMNAWNEGGRDGTRCFNRFAPESGSKDESDGLCQLCADGGELMCCEQCPSTFHLGCMQMEALPEKWYCCYCKCSNCDEPCKYSNRLACAQCDRAHHFQCFGNNEDLDLNKDELGLFCSQKCKMVVREIRSLVGVKFEFEAKGDYTWSLIRRVEAIEMEDDHKRMEWNSKVALAFEVLSESFLPNIDNYTRINILESVVNNTGSNLERVNFRGFYTLVLENKGAVISAATLRVHDGEVAEMPYIATQHKYRLKGMLRKTFKAVTLVLSNIGVKNLVIPAIEDVADMWKGKFAFSSIDHEMEKTLTKYNTLMFPGTIRLVKRI